MKGKCVHLVMPIGMTLVTTWEASHDYLVHHWLSYTNWYGLKHLIVNSQTIVSIYSFLILVF